jgi:RNA polymerase sporulation-specific sigma factor
MLLSNALPLEDVLLVTKVNPEALIIKTESNEEFKVKIKQSLSTLESTVLDYYLSGMSYREIASTINKSVKSVENTLTRIKKKLTEGLKDKN